MNQQSWMPSCCLWWKACSAWRHLNQPPLLHQMPQASRRSSSSSSHRSSSHRSKNVNPLQAVCGHDNLLICCKAHVPSLLLTHTSLQCALPALLACCCSVVHPCSSIYVLLRYTCYLFCLLQVMASPSLPPPVTAAAKWWMEHPSTIMPCWVASMPTRLQGPS